MHSRYASQSHHGVEYDLQLLALSYPPFEHKLCLLVYQRERQISFFGFLGNLVLMFTSIRLKMSFLNHIIIPFSLFSFLWSYTHTQYSITYTQGCKPVWLGLSVEQWGQCLNSKATRCNDWFLHRSSPGFGTLCWLRTVVKKWSRGSNP